jgi:hypothetical protein
LIVQCLRDMVLIDPQPELSILVSILLEDCSVECKLVMHASSFGVLEDILLYIFQWLKCNLRK